MTEAEQQALCRCSLFSGMHPDEIRLLLHCVGGGVVHYEKNAVLWHPGQQVAACAVVLSGVLRAETVSVGGGRTVAAWHRAGALVGDILMASPDRGSPVYVIAAERAAVLLLPFSKVMGGCGQCCPAHARLRENLIQEIAQKYWLLRQRVGYLSIAGLRGRIAAFLLDRAGSSDTFSLGMTREEMADFLCVNRSALSRELSRMKQEGLIDFYRDSFRILKKESCREGF